MFKKTFLIVSFSISNLLFVFSQSLPQPNYPLGYSEIKIVSSTASEIRNIANTTKYAPEKSYDNDLSTEYHSVNDNTVFPVTLKYEFEKSSRLRKIDYYPRTDISDIDGHWKELQIKVYHSDNSVEVVFDNIGNGFTQFNRAYSEDENFYYTIDLNKTYFDVTGVEFIFSSGQNNMITVAELDFWEPSISEFDPNTVFADSLFTQLKSNITLSEINAISDNDFFKNYALELYNGNYNTEFRVQKYKAYPHPGKVGNKLRIYAQSLCSNVTGIYLEKGDEIFVVSDQNVDLMQVNFWPHDPNDISLFDSTVNPLEDQQVIYSLRKGINKIKAEETGLFYVQYWDDKYTTSPENYLTLPEVNLHFMYGRVNGYFDGRKNSRDQWEELINKAIYPYYDVIGNYVQITFPLAGFKELTDNGKDLIDFYDEINYLVRKITGHINIRESIIPNHSHVAGVYKKYKYAAPYATFYNVTDPKSIEKNFNYSLMKDDFFGTAHEWGHSLQITQDLNWGNLTETTCNISAYYAWIEKLGHENSKELNKRDPFNSQYESSWNTFFIEGNSFADQLPGKMAMFWQLYLYSTKVLGIDDFYPNVHQFARTTDPKLKEEDAMLNFTYLVSKSSSKNFNKFFEKWNFFKEGTYVTEDYGRVDTFEMTSEVIDKYKTKVANLGLEEVTDAVEYITDNNFLIFKNKTLITKGTYEISNYSLKPIGWEGVVVYEKYENGKLINIYLNPTTIPIKNAEVDQLVYAVQFDGQRFLVYSNQTRECSSCLCGPNLTQINNTALDLYKENTSNNFIPVPNGFENRSWEGSSTVATTQTIEENFSAARSLDPTVFDNYKTFKIPDELKVLVCPVSEFNCNESQKVEKWFSISPQQRGLFLINSERVARGLPPFEGISSELTEIAQAYSDSLSLANSGLTHNLPIIINGVNTTDIWTRIESNLKIKNNKEFFGFGENLASISNNPDSSNVPLEKAIYNWQYNDGSSWGHRNFNLSILNENSGKLNQEGLLGFGISKIIQNDGWVKYYVVMNGFDPISSFDFNNSLIFCDSVIINQPPATSNITKTVTEQVQESITLIGTDADSDALTYTIVSAPTSGTATITGNTLSYTSTSDTATSDSISYKANDGTADSNVSTITITITPVNDLPVVANQSATLDEDTTKQITLSGTDADGDSLTFVLGTAAHGTVSLSGNVVSYTPNANYNGADSFTYKANDGTADSNEATVSLSITSINDTPSTTNISQTVTEQVQASITLTGTDADNDALTYTIVSAPTNGTATITGNTLSYTSTSDTATADSISYKANDGTADSNVSTITITITPVNDAPIAVADAITLVQGTSATTLIGGSLSVLANDTDEENNPLTAIIVTGPKNGTLSLNPNGTFSYQHNGSAGTTDSFTYKANDGSADSNVVTVNINVSPLTLTYNNFAIQTKSESCSGMKNGEVIINATQSYNYVAHINGKDYNFVNNSVNISSLPPGTYPLCITIAGIAFEQCYNVTIAAGGSITGKSSIADHKLNVEITEGTAPFTVFVNGQSQFEISESNFSVAVKQGDLLEVQSAKSCEGVYSKTVVELPEAVYAYPNPTKGIFRIVVPTAKEQIYVEVYTMDAKLISKAYYPVENQSVQLNIENTPNGVYLCKLFLKPDEIVIVIKK